MDCDFLVIGAGVAGLRAAIELAQAGSVLVIAKDSLRESSSEYAQGGIAVALSDDDEVALHEQDTIYAGDGLCDPEAVRTLVEEGPAAIQDLMDWGAEFDRNGQKLTFGREGAHSRNRILHAHGDSTGREILRALYAKAQALKNISVMEFEFSTDLIVEDGRVCGIHLITEKGETQHMTASAVLLATGGLGQLYRNTTNPSVATGDGVAMAFRAGAEVSDMEFIQFHPTALYLKKAPRFLLSEALRGEGAYLRNIEMDRFMAKYHPLAELAPRDVVARAIMHEMEVSHAKDAFVYLDLTHLKASHVQKRFPRIYATCLQYNIAITEDRIPIRPAAHYSMGGVRTDLNGKTNLAGLYAAGEAAATGVHGANRLPGNSLLEAGVDDARAGKAMRDQAKPVSRQGPEAKAAYSNGPVDAGVEELIGQIQVLLENEVGIVRTRVRIQKAIKSLEEMAPKLSHPKTRRAHEASNLQLTGLLVARSALAREESRGAHYRMDYPDHDDKKFLKHSVIRGDKVVFVS